MVFLPVLLFDQLFFDLEHFDTSVGLYDEGVCIGDSETLDSVFHLVAGDDVVVSVHDQHSLVLALEYSELTAHRPVDLRLLDQTNLIPILQQNVAVADLYVVDYLVHEQVVLHTPVLPIGILLPEYDSAVFGASYYDPVLVTPDHNDLVIE